MTGAYVLLGLVLVAAVLTLAYQRYQSIKRRRRMAARLERAIIESQRTQDRSRDFGGTTHRLPDSDEY